MEADEFAKAFEPPAERSGSLRVMSVDGEFFSKLVGIVPAPKGPLPNNTVSIAYQEPVPKPSIWRHPLRWFSWNPLMVERRSLTFYDCQLSPEPAQSDA